jgi:hypothetical protein
MALNANLVTLVVGGGGLTLFRDHLVTPDHVETQQRTLRAVLQDKLAEHHRRVLNWHAKKILGAESETDLCAIDPIQEHANEIFRGAALLRRLDRIHMRARRIRTCILLCTIAALLGFLGSLAFDALRPVFFLWAVGILAVEVIAVVRSRSCKTELDGANEAV